MSKKEQEKFINSDILEGMSSISSLIKAIEQNKNNRRIIKILFDKSKIKSKYRELSFLQRKSETLGFEIRTTSSEEIDSLTIGNSHGGIVAECTERVIPSLSEDFIKEKGVYFILEGIEDPYNFGYSIRSIYASGADSIILGQRNWMGAAGVVARSSAGSSELMDMYISDIESAVALFKNHNYTVVCAGIRDSVSLFDTELNKPLLVILGGEKRGISRTVLDMADKVVRIDYGAEFGGSLSTSAAAAIFAFEILKHNR